MQVKVDLRSTTYNPADTIVRGGYFGPVTLPKVPGGDVAGLVAEADSDSKFKAGDPVIALNSAWASENPVGETMLILTALLYSLFHRSKYGRFLSSFVLTALLCLVIHRSVS